MARPVRRASAPLLAAPFLTAAVLTGVASADDATKGVPPPPRYAQEGRPAAPVPSGPGGVQLAPPPTGAPGSVQVGSPAPSDPRYGGVLYEKQRVKRTVPLDPAKGVAGQWDVLYTYVDTVGGPDQAGGSGAKTVYADWDDDFVYLAIEMPSAADVRFDLDGRNDGWLRGADNLSVLISPPGPTGGAPLITAQRFDTVQNKDRPVWAEAQIPAAEMRARAGLTPQGTYAVTLAIPRSEVIGLLRKPGTEFGLRVDSGLLPAQVGDADVLSVRPMLRLTLADAVPAATDDGLSLKVKILGTGKVAPGDEVKVTLEARNTGTQPIRLARLFLRGSLASINFMDAATFTGVIVPPGQTVKRELKSGVSPAAETGTYVVAGGAEREDGVSVASLASFDRLEPFAVTFKLDDKPVPPGSVYQTDPKTGKREAEGALRTGYVAVQSRVQGKQEAKVSLALPRGWSLESGETTRTMTLRFAADAQAQYFKLIVPASAAPGAYRITANVDVAGRRYSVARRLTILGGTGGTGTEYRDTE